MFFKNYYSLINRGFIKSSIFLCLFLMLSTNAFSQFNIKEDQWLKYKSRHFIIYYNSHIPEAYVKKVAGKAESYYKKILETLGYRRFNFWTWDNRCKIFLYFSQEQYYNDTGQPIWSAGVVKVKERKISTHIHGEDFLDSVLPHEMGHLIFREFIGPQKDLPLWLDEGVACQQEKKYKAERLQIAKSLVKSNLYIPLDKLTRMNDPESIVLPSIFYSEATSIVDFLIKKFGKNKFLEFSRKLRDQKNWKKSLFEVYKIDSLLQLNQAWRQYLLD